MQTRGRDEMKMFVHGSCDIRFQSSNIRIVANEACYDIEFKNHDFETQAERHEEKSTFEEAVELKMFIDGLYNIGFWCLYI